jgi:uncharacterized protein
MFGRYDIPLEISVESTRITAGKEGGLLVYRRESVGERVEKVVVTDRRDIIISPVEPINKPKEITPFLMIEFNKTLVIEPRASTLVFLVFPIEAGVFLNGDKETQLLDVFTFAKQKYTLYGNQKTGLICRYWKSDIHPNAPDADPLREGVIELSISNSTSAWAEVSKAVFHAQWMRMYYSDALVSMRGYMKIMHKYAAETGFSDTPLREGMNRALELQTARKIPVIGTRFMMEEGL